jgi:hypothetical protein
MTKLGYPLLPVLERAELSVFDRPSGSKGASRVATALGILIVLCLAFPVCFIGFTALTIGSPGAKHSTVAPASWPESVLPGAVPIAPGHGAAGALDENRPDLTTLPTNSSAVAEAPAPAPTPTVAPNSTPQSSLQTEETSSVVRKESDASSRPAEGKSARVRKVNHAQPTAAGARKLGKDKHKNGIAHKHRETNLASDGTTNGK